ncbi:unnamed protein product, partial [Choristocarpus tenellus]
MSHIEYFGRQSRDAASTGVYSGVTVGASEVMRGESGHYTRVLSSHPPFPPVEERVRDRDWNSKHGGAPGYYQGSEVGPVSQQYSSYSVQWSGGQSQPHPRNDAWGQVDSWRGPLDRVHSVPRSDDGRTLGTKHANFQGMMRGGDTRDTVCRQHMDGAHASQLAPLSSEPPMPTVAALPVAHMTAARGGWIVSENQGRGGMAIPGTGPGNANHKSSSSSWGMSVQLQQPLASSAG